MLYNLSQNLRFEKGERKENVEIFSITKYYNKMYDTKSLMPLAKYQTDEENLLNVPYTFESVVKVNIYEDLFINFAEISRAVGI